ncbi:hypothetical protein C2845_PM02G39200 [Panicum miliaceum]|uniref:Uncharacterized protein n=1 Tax=Panicum miliaceum TaxID=4540 RepID=A0A3L6S6I5_PANMI|nr:hypothetical protein C2845_PM02G39200 [Panicum miliaceum]
MDAEKIKVLIGQPDKHYVTNPKKELNLQGHIGKHTRTSKKKACNVNLNSDGVEK